MNVTYTFDSAKEPTVGKLLTCGKDRHNCNNVHVYQFSLPDSVRTYLLGALAR